MELHWKPGLWARIVLLCVGAVWIAGSRVQAQEQKPALPAHFSDPVAAKFHQQPLKEIVATLSKQASLNILIDGESRTSLADLELSGTIEEALNRIAGTFDYTWKVSKGGIVLFNKRFHDRDEAPQASVAELTHLVKSVSDIFKSSNIDPDPEQGTVHLNQLGHSFTQAQLALLLSNKRMPARDLSPDQLFHLRAAALNRTLGPPMKVWSDFAEHLRNFNTGYLTAVPGLEDPAHPGVKQYSYQITWHNRDGSLTIDNFLIRAFTND